MSRRKNAKNVVSLLKHRKSIRHGGLEAASSKMRVLFLMDPGSSPG
jgi:hypothetical protein